MSSQHSTFCQSFLYLQVFSLADLLFHAPAGSPTTTSLSHSPISSQSSDILLNNEDVAAENLPIYPYERLTVVSKDPIGGIDVTKREVTNSF